MLFFLPALILQERHRRRLVGVVRGAHLVEQTGLVRLHFARWAPLVERARLRRKVTVDLHLLQALADLLDLGHRLAIKGRLCLRCRARYARTVVLSVHGLQRGLRRELNDVLAVQEGQRRLLHPLLNLRVNLVVLGRSSALAAELRALGRSRPVVVHAELLRDQRVRFILLGGLGDHEGQAVDAHLLQHFLILHLDQEADFLDELGIGA